jgi:hypothetical protein
MKRLVPAIWVLAAACGGSGYNTGTADLTAVTPMAKSASAKPFVEMVGDMKVRGWTINFIDAGPGTDCMDDSDSIHIVAAIGIYTNQVDDGTHMPAMLTTGDVTIVAASPPSVTGSAAANMGAMGIGGIIGSLTITDYYKDHVNGMVNASGTDGNGNAVGITGSFEAPACGSPP